MTPQQKALQDAATSLETISRLAGRSHYVGDDGERVETYMEHFDQVRGYAASRASVAREALAEPQAQRNLPDCWVVIKDGRIIGTHDEPCHHEGVQGVRYVPAPQAKQAIDHVPDANKMVQAQGVVL